MNTASPIYPKNIINFIVLINIADFHANEIGRPSQQEGSAGFLVLLFDLAIRPGHFDQRNDGQGRQDLELAKPESEILLSDVFTLMEGPLGLLECIRDKRICALTSTSRFRLKIIETQKTVDSANPSEERKNPS